MAQRMAMEQGKAAFLEALKSQQASPASSDFQIVCGDTTYNVHRLVVSLHSGYFERMCEGPYLEAGTRTATLHDDPPLAVDIMINYFYTFELDSAIQSAGGLDHDSGDDEKTTSGLEVLSWVFTLADKYDIRHLGDLAFARLGASFSLDFTQLAFFSRNLLQATRHAYVSGPPNDNRLREIIVQRWLNRDNTLLKTAIKGDFNQVVAEVPEFATDLIEAMGHLTMEGEAGCEK